MPGFAKRMNEEQFLVLAEKINRLNTHCEKIEGENLSLLKHQDEWVIERSKLLKKNDLARNKIEAMIGRLRALEHK